MAMYLLLALCIFYFVQTLVVFSMSREKNVVVSPNNEEFAVRTWDALLAGGGIKNIWQFLVLVVFVPVFFASLSEIVDIFSEKQVTAVSLVYIYCMSTIIVLITLEFAYIYSLQTRAGQWVSMLLVALALDFATLMVFIFGVDDPSELLGGASEPPNNTTFSNTMIFMLITTMFTFVSTFSTLMFAQTAARLADGVVDFPLPENSTDPNGDDEGEN